MKINPQLPPISIPSTPLNSKTYLLFSRIRIQRRLTIRAYFSSHEFRLSLRIVGPIPPPLVNLSPIYCTVWSRINIHHIIIVLHSRRNLILPHPVQSCDKVFIIIRPSLSKIRAKDFSIRVDLRITSSVSVPTPPLPTNHTGLTGSFIIGCPKNCKCTLI